MERKRRYIFDLVLILSLLAVSLFLFFFVYGDKDDGGVAVVYLGSEVVAEYPLSVDGEFSLNGGTNVLKIKDGKAYMLYAECPDGWCKNQGKIYLSGERITCLPNKVMIMIEEGGR